MTFTLEELRDIEKNLKQEYLALVSKQSNMRNQMEVQRKYQGRTSGHFIGERMALVQQANRVHNSLENVREKIQTRLDQLLAE